MGERAGCSAASARPEPPSGGGAWAPAPRKRPSFPPRGTDHSTLAGLAGVAGLGLTRLPSQASFLSGLLHPSGKGGDARQDVERVAWSPRRRRRAGILPAQALCSGWEGRGLDGSRGGVSSGARLHQLPRAAECWAPGLF